MEEVKKLSDIDISDLYMMVKDALPCWDVKNNMGCIEATYACGLNDYPIVFTIKRVLVNIFTAHLRCEINPFICSDVEVNITTYEELEYLLDSLRREVNSDMIDELEEKLSDEMHNFFTNVVA
jgi:hypothetical protein